MSVDRPQIKGLNMPSSAAPQITFIEFINNFPLPRNPFLREEPQPASLEIDPSFFEEERAFLQMKDALFEKYSEKYVAIKDGKVVDSDEDNSALAERVYKKPDVTVYINKVTKKLEVAHLSSPTTA